MDKLKLKINLLDTKYTMKASHIFLQRNKNSMSCKQIGQILILADRLNKSKEALEWMEPEITRMEAQKYIDAMCDKIDDYARGGTKDTKIN